MSAQEGVAFELRVWHDVHGPVHRHLTTDLNCQIDQRLRAASIPARSRTSGWIGASLVHQHANFGT